MDVSNPSVAGQDDRALARQGFVRTISPSRARPIEESCPILPHSLQS